LNPEVALVDMWRDMDASAKDVYYAKDEDEQLLLRKAAYHDDLRAKRKVKRDERKGASAVVNEHAVDRDPPCPRTRAVLLGMGRHLILAEDMTFPSMAHVKMAQAECNERDGKMVDASSSNRSEHTGALNRNLDDRYQSSCGGWNYDEGGPSRGEDGNPCEYELIAHMQLRTSEVKVTTFKWHTCCGERTHHAGQSSTAYTRGDVVSFVKPLVMNNLTANRASVKVALQPYLKLTPPDSFLDRVMDDAKKSVLGTAATRIKWLPALVDELEKMGHRAMVPSLWLLALEVSLSRILDRGEISHIAVSCFSVRFRGVYIAVSCGFFGVQITTRSTYLSPSVYAV
jgi:hypothetical protein